MELSHVDTATRFVLPSIMHVPPACTAAATDRHAHAFAIQMTIDDLIADEGEAPLLIAEESEEPTAEPEPDDDGDTDGGLDSISIFDTDEVMLAAATLPDPEPVEEPLLIISDVDTPDTPTEAAEINPPVAEEKSAEEAPTEAEGGEVSADKPKRRKKASEGEKKPRATRKRVKADTEANTAAEGEASTDRSAEASTDKPTEGEATADSEASATDTAVDGREPDAAKVEDATNGNTEE